VSQRLTSAKESSSKPALQSHEDLARKLQVKMIGTIKHFFVLFLLAVEGYNSVNYLSNVFGMSWQEELERNRKTSGSNEFNFGSLR